MPRSHGSATPIIAKSLAKTGPGRVWGFCVAAAIGAAAIPGYQLFGPKARKVESFAALREFGLCQTVQAVDDQKRNCHFILAFVK